MAGMEQPPEEVLDLLVKELTEGLTPDEQGTLAAAAPEPTGDYRRGFERTAAAISLAAATVDREPLPAPLRERLERAAEAFVAANMGVPAAPPAAHAAAHAANDGGRDPVRAAAALGRAPAAGWWAAAACLVLALFAWLRPPQTIFTPALTVQREPPQPELTAEMRRAALLARVDTLKIPLGATKDPAAAGVTGDIVWDSQAQRGYLRLVGLRYNDPSTQQYQMWIFDGDRDPRYPVDGGVFNAPRDGQAVVIPIHNAIPVHSLKAFAVTVERAGGVVVSAREHVVVLGQAS